MTFYSVRTAASQPYHNVFMLRRTMRFFSYWYIGQGSNELLLMPLLLLLMLLVGIIIVIIACIRACVRALVCVCTHGCE